MKYELYATGLPKNPTYTLLEIKISGQIAQVMNEVTLDAGGKAICAGRPGTCRGNGPDDPIDLIIFAGKGEPKRFALISDDAAHLKAFVSVTPFPNATADKGCRLESVIGTPKGETTFIHGSGFEPNEDLTKNAESYGEKNSVVSKADADGSYFAVALPNVLGKASGVTTWSVKARTATRYSRFHGVHTSLSRAQAFDNRR